MRTLGKENKLLSIISKIQMQMVCKMGGSLWRVKIPVILFSFNLFYFSKLYLINFSVQKQYRDGDWLRRLSRFGASGPQRWVGGIFFGSKFYQMVRAMRSPWGKQKMYLSQGQVRVYPQGGAFGLGSGSGIPLGSNRVYPLPPPGGVWVWVRVG